MDDYAKFQNIAIKFLSYRPRSEKEMREKLLKKKAPPEILQRVMDFLKEQKFINDEEFVKWWIHQRTEYRPKSLRIIKIELKQKGVDSEMIDHVLHATSYVLQPDLDRAKSLVERRIGKYKGLSQFEILQKLGPYLARRGFNYDTIKQAIDEIGREEV